MMCKRAEDFLFPPTGAIGQYRKGYENGYERGKAELAEILDKISAEIKERIANEPWKVLDIIEKYKVEDSK